MKLVLLLLPILTHYFNDCVCAPRLGIAAQTKIVREPSLVYRSMIGHDEPKQISLYGLISVFSFQTSKRLYHGMKMSLKISEIFLYLLDFIF
jgi:hypothetical protein